MPKSKRNKVLSLTNVKPQGSKLKDKLIESIHEASDLYSSVFVIELVNTRNTSLKEMRAQWGGSRFFFGKNKVTQVALGREPSTEHKQNLHKIAELCTGNRGLLFTNSAEAKVLEFFSDIKTPHYARAGNVATYEFKLDEGPLSQLGFAMEPNLRKLGLPTELKRGVITLSKPVVVCQKGDVLTPEQCKILELFEQTMAIFRVKVYASLVGETFTQLINEDEDEEDEDEDMFA